MWPELFLGDCSLGGQSQDRTFSGERIYNVTYRNSAQSETDGCKHWVKLAASAALRRFKSFRFFPELEAETKLYLTAR
jgi:hypothetical protein